MVGFRNFPYLSLSPPVCSFFYFPTLINISTILKGFGIELDLSHFSYTHIKIRYHKLVVLPLAYAQNLIIYHLHCHSPGPSYRLSSYCQILLTGFPASALPLPSPVYSQHSIQSDPNRKGELLQMLQWLFISLRVKTKAPVRHAIIFLTSSPNTLSIAHSISAPLASLLNLE